MTLDVPHGRLLLEPNEHFDRPDVQDASGLVLQAEGPDLRTYRVRHVLAHTPSAESGLRDGDELVEIDGTSVRALTLSDVRARLKRAGRPVRLVAPAPL
jgi:C-terminal processing protease CtpA/Prc